MIPSPPPCRVCGRRLSRKMVKRRDGWYCVYCAHKQAYADEHARIVAKVDAAIAENDRQWTAWRQRGRASA